MENCARDRAVLVLRSAFASLDRANESLGGQVKFRDVDPSGILADLERAGLSVGAISDAEREVLRLCREWSASLRRGDETCALVDSPLVAAVMRLEG